MNTPAQIFEEMLQALDERGMLAAAAPDSLACMPYPPSDHGPWSVTLAIHSSPSALVLTAQLPVPGVPGADLAASTLSRVNQLNRLMLPAAFFADPMGTAAGFRIWLPLAHCRAGIVRLLDEVMLSFVAMATATTSTLCPGLEITVQPPASGQAAQSEPSSAPIVPPQFGGRLAPPGFDSLDSDDIPF